MKPCYFRDFARYVSLNVLGMTALSCYILADTYFISKGMGTSGLAALNLAIPVYSFIHGSGLMIGMGGGTHYSIHKSRGEDEAANKAFTNAAMLVVVFASLFFLAGLFLSETITALLGADGAVFEMTRTYLQVILLFAPAFMGNNLILCFVRNDGAPGLAMAGMIGGSLSYVLLDWVFIFPCGMGIFGAVLATGLAPVISLLILSPHFIRRKNGFKPAKGGLRPGLMGKVLGSGVPSLVTEVSSGVVMIVFNGILLSVAGNTGVAAYGVIANLALVVIAVFTGIAQGMQPLISRYFGLGDGKGTARTLAYGLTLALLFAGVLYAALFVFASPVAGIFNSEGDPLLQQIAAEGMRLYFIGMPFAGINVLLPVYFTSCGRPRPGSVISVLRGFVLIIPMAFLLSRLFGLTGVWCAFPATEAVTAVIAGCMAALGHRIYRNTL